MTYLEQDLNILADYLSEKQFNNKTILVTGATGLIGSLAVKSMLKANDKHFLDIKVIALARSESKAKDVFKEQFNNKNLKFVYQDIVEPIKGNESVDYIIHTANSTVSKYFITNPVETMDSIYTGSRNILEFAKEKKYKA